jgi:hypothetical protein
MGITSFVFRDGANAPKDHIAGADGGGKLSTGVTLVDSNGAEVFVGRQIADIAASFSRQANTTSYAATQVVNDASGNPLLFAGAVRAVGGSGYVASSRLIVNAAALAGVQFRLHLYKTTPGAGTVVDAASWSTAWARRAISLGWIDFLNGISSGAAPDSTLWEGVPSSALALPILSTTADLYAVLTTLTAWNTPASGVGIQANLRVDQN